MSLNYQDFEVLFGGSLLKAIKGKYKFIKK